MTSANADARPSTKTLTAEEAVARLSGKFDVGFLPPPTKAQAFRDRSIVSVCPTRGVIDPETDRQIMGGMDEETVMAWEALQWPQNGRKTPLRFAVGYEVGMAYEAFVDFVLASSVGSFKYLLTIEDDNLPPPDGVMKLIRAIEEEETADGKPYDAVAGLYFMKDRTNTPLAFGDPEEYRKTGTLRFPAADPAKLVPGKVNEVLAVPMGFTLWRMDLFREIEKPWYVSLDDKLFVDDGRWMSQEEIANDFDAARTYAGHMTQDVFFCSRAVQKGKHFGVATQCIVGHKDRLTGRVY
jgi:hypothetical protein